MSSDVAFTNILRPIYEIKAVVAWSFAAVWCAIWGLVLGFSWISLAICVGVSLLYALRRGIGAYRNAKQKLSLMGKPVTIIRTSALDAIAPKLQDSLWLGWGFRWQPKHTQRAYQLIQADIEAIYPPSWVRKLLGSNRDPANERGHQWIHGLEQKEQDVIVPLSSFKGHCAIIAVTGAIKTRLLSLIMYQLIRNGDVVIVFDPKGDAELKAIMRKSYEQAGIPEKFLMCHPAFASQSVRFDVLKNWDRVSQVASRVSLVLSSQEDSTFKDFCWKAVHSITSGMRYLGRRVTLHSLNVAMTSRNSVERLAEEALTKFFTTEAPMFTDKIVDEVNQLRYSDKGKQRGKGMVLESDSKELAAMVSIFNRDLSETDDQARRTEIPAKPDAIRGLVAILEANKEWFGKMIVSITPMLTKLTTDDLRGLLSPDYDDINDQRPIVDSMRIVEGGYGLYFGTDALADNTVAKALAAMALADASAVAAEIYNYSQDNPGTQQRRVHIFLDEWRDSMCEAAIQIAGKGRGAGLHLWALGQTLPDLVDALGSETAALTFMGNMNNLIVGATNDQSTIELITRKLGETVVVDKTTAQSVGSKTEDTGLEYSVNTATKISAKDMALFPEPLLPGMPDLQFIGVFNRAQIIKGRIPVLKI